MCVLEVQPKLDDDQLYYVFIAKCEKRKCYLLLLIIIINLLLLIYVFCLIYWFVKVDFCAIKVFAIYLTHWHMQFITQRTCIVALNIDAMRLADKRCISWL